MILAYPLRKAPSRPTEESISKMHMPLHNMRWRGDLTQVYLEQIAIEVLLQQPF
jgi:hypothetical protein